MQTTRTKTIDSRPGAWPGPLRAPTASRSSPAARTGSGDNRFKTFGRGGWVKSSRAVSRTATFAFYVGDRYFGVLTAFVPGKESDRNEFTSALSVNVRRLLAPTLNTRLAHNPADAVEPLRANEPLGFGVRIGVSWRLKITGIG